MLTTDKESGRVTSDDDTAHPVTPRMRLAPPTRMYRTQRSHLDSTGTFYPGFRLVARHAKNANRVRPTLANRFARREEEISPFARKRLLIVLSQQTLREPQVPALRDQEPTPRRPFGHNRR